jgi:hypothetical protein
MGRNSLSHKPVAESSVSGHRKRPLGILARHTLLTDDWTGDVQAIEAAIGQFTADRPFTNDCQVVLFEMADDPHLHVNVTHRHPTAEVTGWAGPGSMPEGHVHNRLFGVMAPSRIIRHIHDMVFAARI